MDLDATAMTLLAIQNALVKWKGTIGESQSGPFQEVHASFRIKVDIKMDVETAMKFVMDPTNYFIAVSQFD